MWWNNFHYWTIQTKLKKLKNLEKKEGIILEKNQGILKEKLKKLVSFKKNVQGFWEASITLKDGFKYSSCEDGNAKIAKKIALERLLSSILAQNDHPLPIDD